MDAEAGNSITQGHSSDTSTSISELTGLEKLQVLQESHGGRSSPNGDAFEGVSPLDCAKELEGIPLSALLSRCHAAADPVQRQP